MKVIESVIKSNILKFLETNHLTYYRQYGLCHEISTADFLTFVTQSWNKSQTFRSESQVQNAFDKVWHTALLHFYSISFKS